MKKTILAAINAKFIHSNLAVQCLSAYAKKHLDQETGDAISIAEYTINQSVEYILQDIYRQRPEVLCFSCYIWNIRYTEEICGEIHKVLPGIQIWLGGPEVSFDAVERLTKMPFLTGIIKGEGEKTFLELMRYYSRKDAADSLDDIAGITYREKGAAADGSMDKIVENPWRGIMDLCEVPFVYEDLSAFENKIIYYETSRGCPFSCSYCLSSIDKTLRFRDLSLVLPELQHFLDHKVPQVKFVDRTFNCKHDHAMAIWRYLKEHDNGVTNFHFEVAADLLNDAEIELVQSMRKGLIQLEVGVQSTNPDTIQEIHRVMDFEEVKDRVGRVQAADNIHQHLDLIAGLPFEDYESFARSFRDVYALHPEQLQLGFLKVLKGSLMHRKAAEYDLQYLNSPPYEVLSTKWLSYDEICRLKGIEEMVEVYYNSHQFEYTMRALEEDFPDSFRLFEMLSIHYKENGLTGISHSRVRRYEILLDFLENETGRGSYYRELLVLDLYMRENMKSRPDFAGEDQMDSRLVREFYDKESKKPAYLHNYAGYQPRQIRKMTHLEQFSHDVLGNKRPGRRVLLFDYRNRDVRTAQAAVFDVTDELACKMVANSIR